MNDQPTDYEEELRQLAVGFAIMPNRNEKVQLEMVRFLTAASEEIGRLRAEVDRLKAELARLSR